MRIAVAGAGLSGLALCHALQERLSAAGRQAEIILLESEGRVGGKIRTHRQDGYVMEWGPNGFLNNKPDTLELCRKLGIEGLLLPSNDAARRRFVYAGGRLHELKAAEFMFGDLLSWRGKFRLLGELFVPRKTDDKDETLAEFARRRLGPEALERLIGPMASGVYGGDPEQMSLRACFPLIYNLERDYGGLFRGFLGKMKDNRKKARETRSGPAGPGGVLTSFAGGLEVLTDSLKGAFKGELLLSSPVRKVQRAEPGRGFVLHAGDGVTINADVFVTASPAFAAAEFMASLDSGISAALSEIKYVPMAVVSLGFESGGLGHDLNGFGFLVGMKEGRRILGALWDSSVFKGRAPKGRCSIRSMAGGGRDTGILSLGDGEMREMVLGELRHIMGIRGAPVVEKVFRHEKAIPSYTPGHNERLARLDAAEARNPGLFFTGNAYRGVALNDCVREAYAVADKVMKAGA